MFANAQCRAREKQMLFCAGGLIAEAAPVIGVRGKVRRIRCVPFSAT
jgi:hypothetical protein